MMISRGAYLKQLRAQVSEEERMDLENDDIILISSYNRATMLRLLHESDVEGGTVDTRRAEELRQALEAYLDRYMAEYPQGHKWIILCCLFLAMVAREPMHPQMMTGWRKQDGAYYCRAREEQEGSVCRWCVCRPMP